MDFNKLFDKIELYDIGRESFFKLQERTADKAFRDKLILADIYFKRGDDIFEPYLKSFADEEGVAAEILNLYIFLRKSEELLAEYLRRGYGDDVFYDSMRAISVAARFYYELNGIYGISPTHRMWFRRLFACSMFRFGRLEFEPYASKFDLELEGKSIKKGDLCVTVHIPRYDNFAEEHCEDSYRRAREFFKEHFGVDELFIFCTSWLIDPWISESLGEGSNIAKFQQKYKVLEITENTDVVISWVFNNTKYENIDDYPEDTSMQRIVKDRLKKGLPVGVAAGVRL